jgi:integrase
MHGVFKRKSGWFAVLWDKTAKKQKQVKLPADVRTEKQAVKEKNRLQINLDRENLGLQTSSPTSLDSWVMGAQTVLDEVESHDTDSWYKNCVRYIKHFAKLTGNIPAAQVTEEMCSRFVVRRIEESASKSEIKKEMTFLARIFRRAGNDCWRNVRKPSEPLGVPDFYTPEEFARLVKVAPSDRNFRYHVLTLAGTRPSEAMKIRWGIEVDMDNRIVKIHNSAKGQGPRYPIRLVPMSKPLYQAFLNRKKEINPKHGDPIFHTRNNWNRDLNIDIAATEDKEKNIPPIKSGCPKKFRHTFCSWLVQSGMPLQEVRDLAGHQSITTTERYAHLMPKINRSAADALSQKYIQSIDEKQVIEEKKAC